MFRMPKNDPEVLKMALAGYEAEKLKIDDLARQVREMLDGGKPSSAAVDEPAPKRKRRKMSAAARKRIGDATRKRWALGRMNTKKTTSNKRLKLSPAERARISGGQAKMGKGNEVPF